MKLRHTGITVIKQQLEFRYFIDKYIVLNFTRCGESQLQT